MAQDDAPIYGDLTSLLVNSSGNCSRTGSREPAVGGVGAAIGTIGP